MPVAFATGILQSCKPGSVGAEAPLCHLSRPNVTVRLKQPTRSGDREDPDGSPFRCLFGFSTPEVYHPGCCQTGRGLLPRVFTLTL